MAMPWRCWRKLSIVVIVAGISSSTCFRGGFWIAQGGDDAGTDRDAEQAGGTDSSTSDAAEAGDVDIGGDADDDASGRVELDGEEVFLAEGWSVEIAMDFSNRFSLPAEPFVDVNVAYEQPRELFLLPDPFPEGVGVIAGRRIYALAPPDGVEEHDYSPATIDEFGPDSIRQAHAVSDFDGNPVMFVSSGSWNGGDGVYRVERDWSITRMNNNNNIEAVVADSQGRYDGRGVPTLYWSNDRGLRREGPVTVFDAAKILECVLLASDDMACVTTAADDWVLRSLEVFASTSHDATTVAVDVPDLNLVSGDLSGSATGLFAVQNRRELVVLDFDGEVEVHARTLTSGWQWVAAVIPPGEHILGGDGSFYLVEFNGNDHRYRLLRLQPPRAGGG
jgi:hypothetical protein